MLYTESAPPDRESKRCLTRLSKDEQPLATTGTSEQYPGLNKSSDRQADSEASKRLRHPKSSQYDPARLKGKLRRQKQRKSLRQSDDVAEALVTSAAVVAVEYGEPDQLPNATALDIRHQQWAHVGQNQSAPQVGEAHPNARLHALAFAASLVVTPVQQGRDDTTSLDVLAAAAAASIRATEDENLADRTVLPIPMNYLTTQSPNSANVSKGDESEASNQGSSGYRCYHPGCKQAYKVFDTPSSLTKHKKCHTPAEQRPYHCDSCTYTAYEREDLRRHMKTYTGKTEVCPTCSQEFARADNLRRHILNLHNN